MPEIIVRDTQAMDFEEVRRGRVHMIRRKRLPLETGIDGITMEYSLSVVPDGYFTPRHRHNFDQIRYTLSGVQSTGLGDLAAGECGYFPEGSHYGPQQQKRPMRVPGPAISGRQRRASFVQRGDERHLREAAQVRRQVRERRL